MLSKLFRVITCTGLVLAGCGNPIASNESGWPYLLSLVRNETSLKQTQVPWCLAVQGLSEEKLRLLSAESESNSSVVATTSATTTVAVKLRLQSQDPKLQIADLLQNQAPTYSPDKIQDALFYHMAEAGYLQVAGNDVRPVTAYVEMTTQRDQCVDIVFIFALTRLALERVNTAKFIVDKAFFLSQPVEFTLPTAQLLPVL